MLLHKREVGDFSAVGIGEMASRHAGVVGKKLGESVVFANNEVTKALIARTMTRATRRNSRFVRGPIERFRIMGYNSLPPDETTSTGPKFVRWKGL